MLAANIDWGMGFGTGLAALGAAGGVIGAGFGISKIASASVESMARQPEAAGNIRGAMIITAALIEGVALFGVAAGFMAQSGLVGAIQTALGKP